MIYLLVPFYRAPGMFWFMTSIMQCYLLTPFLYTLDKKMRAPVFIVVNLASICLLMFPSLFTLGASSPAVTAYLYKAFLFGNILLFSLGMTMPAILRKYGAILQSKAVLMITTVFFIFFLFLIGISGGAASWTKLMIDPPFFISVFTLCLLIMIVNPPLPFRRTIGFFGRYAYSIYLFHMSFFGLIAYLGLTSGKTIINLAIVVLCAPLFLITCALLELGSDKAINLLEKKIFHRSGAF